MSSSHDKAIAQSRGEDSGSLQDESNGPVAALGGSGHGHGWPAAWLKGVGLSVWQNSFDESSQWSDFVKKKKILKGGPQEALMDEKSNDFWNHYENDIKMAAKLGCNSFRLSLEWARFCPTAPGQIVHATVTRYNEMIDVCESLGMSVMLTLHHFTHPAWFEASGGFANDANIPVFLDYARDMMRLFGRRVQMWATFNEPTCFAFVGYIIGLWAPGELMHFKRAGKVLRNLLRCHVAAYKALKVMPEAEGCLIGLVHQHIKFFPKQEMLHTQLLCKWMTYWFGTDVLLAFFTKGIFTWRAPWVGVVYSYEDPDAPHTLDWWGINYYSRPALDWKFARTCLVPKERITDTDFRIFPQGLYDSISDASVLKVPIVITETGLADAEDRHRDYFIRAHYQQVLRAVKDGFDVRGVYFWTLMDNIEWHEGFHVKFGLYEWDPSTRRTEGPLKMRAGSQALVDIHRAWPDTREAMARYVLSNDTHPAMSPLLEADDVGFSCGRGSGGGGRDDGSPRGGTNNYSGAATRRGAGTGPGAKPSPALKHKVHSAMELRAGMDGAKQEPFPIENKNKAVLLSALRAPSTSGNLEDSMDASSSTTLRP